MKLENIKSVEIVTHFLKDDPECICDYTSVDILINGKRVEDYGDAYHDRGDEKVDGFLDALKFLGVDLSIVKRTEVADCEG